MQLPEATSSLKTYSDTSNSNSELSIARIHNWFTSFSPTEMIHKTLKHTCESYDM